MYETDALPAGWREACEQWVDEVWLPSEFNAQARVARFPERGTPFEPRGGCLCGQARKRFLPAPRVALEYAISSFFFRSCLSAKVGKTRLLVAVVFSLRGFVVLASWSGHELFRRDCFLIRARLQCLSRAHSRDEKVFAPSKQALCDLVCGRVTCLRVHASLPAC
eukprot:6205374-Pleurochrysis_carterae.AAC.1